MTETNTLKPLGSTAGLDADWAAPRAAFVEMVKEENFYRDFSRWSLKQHPSGPKHGFSDEMLQRRWADFRKGWEAASNA
jgi:hypothetical protein